MCRPVRFVIILLPCLLASCAYSTYPLSDEKTSKIDQRLIGGWVDCTRTDRYDPTREFLFGKAKDSKNTMELVHVKWDHEKSISLERWKVFAIKMKFHYLSVQFKTKKGEFFYGIARYEMPDNNTIHIYDMEHGNLRTASKAGKIKIKSWSEGRSLNSEKGGNDSLIEEKTEDLLKIINKNPQFFEQKPTVILKRKSSILSLKK